MADSLGSSLATAPRAESLSTPGGSSPADIQAAEFVAKAHRSLLEQMSRVIVGQSDVVDLLVLGLLCQGHCILEGVPGLAKTLMISSLAKLLSLEFGRI